MKFNKEKLEQVKDNKYFSQEMETLQNKDVSGYYDYLIDNEEMDRSNPCNSYVMWLCDKVNVIDLDKPSKITPANISLPDIDVDVPAEHRDEVIDYIKEKYGHDNVSQMITFGRLQGRAALKEVLRINDAVSFTEMNEITKSIPNEAEISDQLEVSDDKSIINWALENQSEELEGWCRKDDDGNLVGPLADIFKQAIRIEGTNKSHGKHAAGVIVSKHRLKDVCPMINDKNGIPVAAFEMGDLETLGLVKLDILGIDLLSKVMEIKI